jgi:hypothetical protein
MDLPTLVDHCKGYADATDNSCLISTLAQLCHIHQRATSNAFPPLLSSHCLQIREAGLANGIAGFAQFPNGSWEYLDLHAEAVTFILNQLNFDRPVRVIGWSTRYHPDGHRETELADVFDCHPSAAPAHADPVTFHLWAWGHSCHFEPLWHPWEIIPQVRDLSHHAAAAIIAAAIPPEEGPPVPNHVQECIIDSDPIVISDVDDDDDMDVDDANFIEFVNFDVRDLSQHVAAESVAAAIPPEESPPVRDNVQEYVIDSDPIVISDVDDDIDMDVEA